MKNALAWLGMSTKTINWFSKASIILSSLKANVRFITPDPSHIALYEKDFCSNPLAF